MGGVLLRPGSFVGVFSSLPWQMRRRSLVAGLLPHYSLPEVFVFVFVLRLSDGELIEVSVSYCSFSPLSACFGFFTSHTFLHSVWTGKFPFFHLPHCSSRAFPKYCSSASNCDAFNRVGARGKRSPVIRRLCSRRRGLLSRLWRVSPFFVIGLRSCT